MVPKIWIVGKADCGFYRFNRGGKGTSGANSGLQFEIYRWAHQSMGDGCHHGSGAPCSNGGFTASGYSGGFYKMPKEWCYKEWR